MAKNLTTKDPYDARAPSLLNSEVQLEAPQRRMSRIIPNNRMLLAYIYICPPSIKADLQSKVAQITNQDMFIFGRDHNL